ncbi:unnamed protein product [Larinioides sclopetarius]|uniref:Uncharacterized protein n=1 Tax=Larinioides sclopetarius TaxID=280406 RepID=A0AAV2A6N3_9ARAC
MSEHGTNWGPTTAASRLIFICSGLGPKSRVAEMLVSLSSLGLLRLRRVSPS